MATPSDSSERLKRYMDGHNLTEVGILGDGVHGVVIATSKGSAVKVFSHFEPFQRERHAYRRLTEHRVSQVFGFNVPQLIFVDESLCILEISIVSRPHILDFAAAHLDDPPDFGGVEAEEEHWERIRGLYGDRHQEVFDLLYRLQSEYGIWYFDVRPGNVSL